MNSRRKAARAGFYSLLFVGVALLAWAIVEVVIMQPVWSLRNLVEIQTELARIDQPNSAETNLYPEIDQNKSEPSNSDKALPHERSTSESAISTNGNAEVPEPPVTNDQKTQKEESAPTPPIDSQNHSVDESGNKTGDSEQHDVQGDDNSDSLPNESHRTDETSKYTDGVVRPVNFVPNSDLGEAKVRGDVKLTVHDGLYFRETWLEKDNFENLFYSKRKPSPNPKMVNGWIINEISWSNEERSVLKVEVMFTLRDDQANRARTCSQLE